MTSGGSATSYGDVIQRTREGNVLFSVMLELTYRCNLDCFFCYNDLDLRGKTLSLDRYSELLDELQELGVLHLILTGGEPLASPYFFELGRRARELRFAVRVKSNGHALHGHLARRLRDEVDPMIVEVSLHGATAETHERQTRVQGSFRRLLDNLVEMQKLGLRLKINSTLTCWNEDEIEAMFDLADGLGLPLQFDPEVTPRDDGDRSPLTIAPSRSGLTRLFRLQQRRAQRYAAGQAETPSPPPAREGDQVAAAPASGGYCGAGTNSLTIDPFGKVYPCVQWRRPVGDLHRQSVSDIWHGIGALRDVRRENAAARSSLVVLGQEAGLASFCPGQAAVRTGRADTLYPEALERVELRRAATADADLYSTDQGSPLRENVSLRTGMVSARPVSVSITGSQR
ncbi:MAG: radical SAM protein [Thermoanaerobaculia bacterium]|nr:radical SAM protein [Thermoanaerobaculia bacterium]